LDDVLSAIDSKTERLIVERLLGKDGLFRTLGSTVVLATHASEYSGTVQKFRRLTSLLVRHLSLADNIIVLDANGRISEQGSFKDLHSQDGFISKIMLHPEILEQGSSKQPNEEVSTKKASQTPRIVPGPTPNDIAERTRRVGDFSVYKYYFAAIGWKLGSSIVLMAVIFMITGNFPCEFESSKNWIKEVTHFFSNPTELVF
jgi:hypothetical protein